MGGKRLEGILLCIGLIIATVSSAAVTTQETIVVTRAEDEVSSPIPPESGPTTEEPSVPIKLTEMRVHSEIALRYARTSVVTKVRNPSKRAQEAVFRMLLPETAFISGFIMTLDGKAYKAYVKEKEEAKNIYNQAVSQGIGAAHISAKARDSNHFTVVVNVEPNITAVFNLTYEELLVRRDGVYKHAINLHPGALVPKLKVTVHIKESEKITTLRVPEVKTGNEVDATDADAQNPIAAVDRGHDDREATITFKPDLQEQKRLIDVYAAKSRESASNKHLYLSDNSDENDKKEGTIGQFVVQYDVDRTNNKEVLVNDGYFVHFLAPSSLPPLKKHAVFVLDTSGSMMGRKVEQLREAMQTIMEKLNPGDYFSIIEFNSDVKVHNLNEADKPQTEKRRYWDYNYKAQNTELVPPSLATPENINKAKIIISRLQAYGGTNIHSALTVAISLIRKGVDWKAKSNTTDTQPTTEQATTIASEEGRSLVNENDSVIHDLEPIIIFLTDGDPTEGETSTTRILSHISENNYGDKKASIFSLAFGEDADRDFLRKLSLKNEGFMRHIYEAADAALQLRNFYREVSSPLLSNVQFTYPKDQIKEGTLTRSKFRTVYAGSEVVVAGRILDEVKEIAPQVTGFCGVEDGVGKKRYSVSPKIPVNPIKNDYMPLERLWAYLTIKQLLDEKDISDSDVKSENSPEKKALQIALKYEFVTPLTSLVVVKPNATNAVNAESVDNKRTEFAAYRPMAAIPLIGSGQGSAPHYMSGSMFGSVASPIFASGSFHLEAEAEEPELQYDLYEDGISAAVRTSLLRNNFDLSRSGGSRPRPVLGRTSKKLSGVLFFPTMFSVPSYSTSLRYGDEDDFTDKFASTFAAATSTTQLPSPLSRYHLEEFKWAEEVLDDSTETLNFNANGTEVHLRLVKDATVPMTSGGDVECLKSTSGAVGVCVYVSRCRSAKNISLQQYQELYCEVNNEYAGVCCPSIEVDNV